MSIIDAVPIVLLFGLRFYDCAKAVQVIARIVKGVVVMAACELLNLPLNPFMVQLDVLRTPVELETSLEEPLLRVQCHHRA